MNIQLKNTYILHTILDLEFESPGTDDDYFNRRTVMVFRNHSSDQFKVVIYRQEFFRIQPTFPQTEGIPADEPCDELLLIEEETIYFSGQDAADSGKTFEAFIAAKVLLHFSTILNPDASA